MSFDLPVGMCPKCKSEGAEIYASYAGNKLQVVCPRGHVFSNLNDFQANITKQERKKMNKDKEAGFRSIATAMRPSTPSNLPVDGSDVE